MEPKVMNLKILLPYQVFANLNGVKRLVVETQKGSFGLLPRRLDCCANLIPGILIYETDADGEVFVAVDEGVMVKAGENVVVSVRNAFTGPELGKLHQAVGNRFLNIGEQERLVRNVMAKLEIGFIRRFEMFQKKQR